MKKFLFFLSIFTLFFLYSCSLEKENIVFDVGSSLVFSEKQVNVFSFDYFGFEKIQSFDYLYRRFKDFEFWNEYGIELNIAHFKDEIEVLENRNVFRDYIEPILNNGFDVSFAFDDEIFNFESGVFSVSFNTKSPDLLVDFLNLYFSNRYKANLKKQNVNGLSFWIVENENIFVCKKGNNFVFSNSKQKIEEISENLITLDNSRQIDIENESLIRFSNVDFSFFPKFDLDLFLEEEGLRFYFKYLDEVDNTISLLDFVSSENLIFFVESSSLKKFFKNIDFDTDFFLGLKKEEFQKILLNKFSFAFSVRNNYPEFVFYIDLNKYKEIGNKFISFLDKFVLDLQFILKTELSGEEFSYDENFIKFEKFDNLIRKVSLDFSLIEKNKIYEFKSFIPFFEENEKVEIYYGLSNSGLMMISLYKDFFDYFNKQSLQDFDKFKKMKNVINIEVFDELVFLDLEKLDAFINDFFNILLNFEVLKMGEFTKYSKFFDMIFENFSSLIILGENNEKSVELEGFLAY